MIKNAVIIGAGPAGLTAALELLEKAPGVSVTVLEAADAVGGISRTVCFDGNRMDLGGHRFFSKDERVLRRWESLLPMQGAPALDDRLLGRDVPLLKGGPDPEREDGVMLRRSRVSRIYWNGRFFDYPVTLSAGTLKNMGLRVTAQVGISYIAAALRPLPETSLENFYINRFGRKLYSMFFESYTEKLWGRHPSRISAAWGAQRVKGLSVTAVLKNALLPKKKDPAQVETSLIESFIYPKFGPGQMWETAAERVKALGGRIRMGCEVTGLETRENRVTAVLAGGERILADAVLSSMPLCDLVAGMNDVPEDVSRIAKGLPYRDFVTVGLLVDSLLLKEKGPGAALGGITPDCWIYVQDASVRLGRIQIFNNWSPYMVADPVHTALVGLEYFCREGDDFWNLSDEDCVRLAVSELRKIGVLSEDARVLNAHRERVKKAYPAYFDTYAQMDILRDYLDSFGNLYLIGRNGQHRYNNMDHSMMTAYEAVRDSLSGATDHQNVWNVNTEQVYHEGGSNE